MEDVIKARESIAMTRENNTGLEDRAEATVQSEGLYCRRWAMTGKKNEELNQTSLAAARENPGCRIAKLIDAVLAQIPVGSNRIHFTSVTLYPPRRAVCSRFDSGTSH
jgi:hypothetical protein